MKVTSLNEYLYLINEYKLDDYKQLFITFILYSDYRYIAI